MAAFDRFSRALNNLYTRVFEQGGPPKQNQRYSFSQLSRASITVTENSYAIQTNALGSPRYYADLTVAGSDTDVGASAYGITGATQRIQYGSGVLYDGTAAGTGNGWCVVRLKPNWAFNAALSRDPTIFKWGTGTSYIQLLFKNSVDSWCMRRVLSPSITNEHLVASTHVSGTSLTLAAKWTNTVLGLSINGAAFTTTASTNWAFGPFSSLFDIGTSGAANQDLLDASIHWMIFGTGVISDADVSTLHGNGDTDPANWAAIPNFGTNKPSFFWKAVDATHEVPAVYGEANYV